MFSVSLSLPLSAPPGILFCFFKSDIKKSNFESGLSVFDAEFGACRLKVVRKF